MVLMIRFVVVLSLTFITSVSYSLEKFQQSKGQFVYNPPYYVNYGYLKRSGDLQSYAPYIGIGVQKTKFSSSFFASIGTSINYKQFTWKLEYLHAFLPDLSLFNFNNLEYYGQNIFMYDFNSHRVSSKTQVGKFLFAFPSQNDAQLEQNAFTSLGIRQIFSLDSQLFNNDIVFLTSMVNLGFQIVPEFNQSSFYMQAVMPITFDFLHSKLGLMGSFFYLNNISKSRAVIIGEKYSGYDEAIDVLITKPDGLYNKFYDLTATVDLIYRVYIRALPTPYDRFYFAIGANTGFGMVNNSVDLLYMGVIALGYELHDIIPFEIRFSLDQDRNFFFNISVVSPIAHRFDSNLD